MEKEAILHQGWLIFCDSNPHEVDPDEADLDRADLGQEMDLDRADLGCLEVDSQEAGQDWPLRIHRWPQRSGARQCVQRSAMSSSSS